MSSATTDLEWKTIPIRQKSHHHKGGGSSSSKRRGHHHHHRSGAGRKPSGLNITPSLERKVSSSLSASSSFKECDPEVASNSFVDVGDGSSKMQNLAFSSSQIANTESQKPLYSAALTDLLPQQQRLMFLKRSLHNAWQLSFQSREIHQEILATLNYYTEKIKKVVSSKSIWNAPPNTSQNLYEGTARKIFQPSTVFNSSSSSGKDLYFNLVATPAEEPHLVNPTPIYPTQLPSYLFEADYKPGKRLLRTRSTSWSTPIRPPGFEYSPKRLLSPPFMKRNTDLDEIQAKLEKAQELRELIIAAKLKKQTEKSQAAQQRLNQQEEIKEEQRKQLKESIDEKLSKAEKLRTEHLHNIKKKAKVEEMKRDEIQHTTQQIILNKKLEVESKLQESEQRKLEIDDVKQRKTTGVLALQEAATKRRNEFAQQKLEKLAKKEAQGLHRVEQLGKEQNRKIALANEKKNRVQSRVQELQSKKTEVEEEKKRALLEKLELSAQRKEDQVRQVREKAAAANQNAKSVASRVQSNRKFSESTDPNAILPGLLSPTFEMKTLDEGAMKFIKSLLIDIDNTKALTKKTKKIKQKLEALTKDYVYPLDKNLTVSTNEKTRVATLIKSLNTALKTFKPNKESSIKNLDDSLSKFTVFLSHESESMHGIDQICSSGCLDHIITLICGIQLEIVSEISILSPALSLMEKILSKDEGLDFICQSHTLIPVRLLDLLSSLISYCAFNRPNSVEIMATKSLLQITANVIEHCKSSEFLGRIAQQLISYSFTNGVFEKLKTLFSLVHGTPDSLDAFAPFIMTSCELLSCIITFGNQKYFTCPVYESRKLSQQSVTVLNFCIESNMVGLITLLDSILLSVSGSYRAAVQVTLSSSWIKQSLLVFKMLNKLCMLDLKMVQDWLALHDHITELFHLMLFWMQYFSTQGHPKSLFSIIDELAVLVGYVCQGHTQNTQMVCVGLPGPSLLQRLCQLPFEYFNTPRGRSVLFPTLIALAVDGNNRTIIEEDISLEFFQIFIKKTPDSICPQLRKAAFLIS